MQINGEALSNGAASGRHHGPRALGVTWVLYSGGHPPGFPISPLYRFAKLQDESPCVRNLWLVHLQVAFGGRIVTCEQLRCTPLTHKF